MPWLQAFWIARQPFDDAGQAERFGVSGYSLADALDLLVWAGVRLNADHGRFLVTPIASHTELQEQPGFRAHVEFNMGPLVCRGVWYPWITAIPPQARAKRMDNSLAFPPPNKLAACLAVLERAAIRLRLLGYAGEHGGLGPAESREVVALADAVHNLPYLIQHWDTCDESRLRGMLQDCDSQFPDAAGLLAAYEDAARRAG